MKRRLEIARASLHSPRVLFLDEAERVAHRIAVIDHGRIADLGTAAELKARTGTDSLEGAFLALTGTALRDETAGNLERMRQLVKGWRR